MLMGYLMEYFWGSLCHGSFNIKLKLLWGVVPLSGIFRWTVHLFLTVNFCSIHWIVINMNESYSLDLVAQQTQNSPLLLDCSVLESNACTWWNRREKVSKHSLWHYTTRKLEIGLPYKAFTQLFLCLSNKHILDHYLVRKEMELFSQLFFFFFDSKLWVSIKKINTFDVLFLFLTVLKYFILFILNLIEPN